MKILVITKWLVPWNGASRVVYELSKRFKVKHTVKIIVYEDYVHDEWEKEFDVYKLKRKGLMALPEIRRVINEYKPDIIHSHDWLGLLGLNSKVPEVVTTHSNWPMNWFFSFTDFAAGVIQGIPHEIQMHLANKVICVAKYQQKKLRSRGISSDVIYNGFAEELLQESEKEELMHPCILFVGGIDSRKAGYLASVVEALGKKTTIHTYIIGRPVDKEIFNKLKGLPNTYCLGVKTDVKPYYYSADALIFTSKAECLPLVPIEAQACGLPVIAFNVCSNSEIVENGKTGFLVTPFNIEEMANKIIALTQGTCRPEMSKQASINAKNKFSWDDKANEYLSIFENLKRGAQ